jgi:ketosteroid isomerase-like protein
MRIWKALAIVAVSASVIGGAGRIDLAAQAANQAGAAEIFKADRDFAKSVADQNKDRFLSFVAEITTFSGGTPNELKGRDAVWKEWSEFFAPNGPRVEWAPTKAEVIGNGTIGYSVGRSLFKVPGPDGKVTERRGEYLTVWRKQPDGSWQAIFDTGSSLP